MPATRQTWGAARVALGPECRSPDVLDQMIIWRMNDPRYQQHEHLKGTKQMQRQWTIEARADFADPDKNAAITEAVRQHAVALNATLVLIKDNGISPQVVCYSDDFFTGHEDINLMENKLGAAMAESGSAEPMGVSEDMMQAMRDMQHDKNSKS